MDEYNEQSDPHREPRKPFAYSVEEAAKIAGLSRSSIYLALGDGRLRSLRRCKQGPKPWSRRWSMTPSGVSMNLHHLPKLLPTRPS